MTSDDRSVLYALAIEPCSARAGEVVRVVFRTRNLGARPSPPASVAFALGAGLEALDPVEVAVEPVASGEDVVASVRARVSTPLDDRTEIPVRAALHLAGAVLETNVRVLVVRSRAVLDGPASGTFVEALGADAVRARAVVVNEGDGPACEVRIIVPAPAGCARLEGDGPAELEIARLEPGERAELAFEARIVAPAAEVRADDGEVRYGDGRRVALAARGVVVPEPVLAAPVVSTTRSRRRVDVAVDVCNEGRADARDVRVAIALPSALRAIDGSIVVDGVPVGEPASRRRTARGRGALAIARVERAGDAYAVVIADVPARGTVRVAMAAAVTAFGAAAGDTGGASETHGAIVVTTGLHEVEVPFVPEHVRELRVRVAGMPRVASPGDVVPVAVRIVNAGDVTEALSVRLEDASRSGGAAVQRTLAPGAVAAIELALPVPEQVSDDVVLPRTVVVSDATGERARAEVALVVRDRAWLALDEPPVCRGGRAWYTIRNGGSTPARDAVASFGELTIPLGKLAPGSAASFDVDEHAARGGGTIAAAGRSLLDLPGLRGPVRVAVHAALRAPEYAVAGAPVALRLDLDVEDAVDELAISVPAVEGTAYVPGSTLVDGRVLLDRAASTHSNARSPLDADGLTLRAVPGGTRITLGWSLLAAAEPVVETLAVAPVLCVNGETFAIEPVRIAVRAPHAFAARPADLPYHVDACAIAAPNTIADESSEPMDRTPHAADAPHAAVPQPGHRHREIVFGLRLDRERADEIARLVGAMHGAGLAAHLFALRLFFPDSASAWDGEVCAALDDVHAAMRDVFDRLFVKLRIPGFGVSSDDLEDSALRHALLVLFERLGDSVPDELALADAPYGAPVTMRALAALLPARCDDPAVAAVLRKYARLLDDVLRRYEGLPLELFDDALARRSDATLDDARAELLAALRPHVTRAEAVC